LANFLATSGGSLVLVSHDEQLLEGACDRMTEVRGKKLHHYVGNYTKFLQLREERAAQAAATAASQAAEIARLEQFIARFGAKAAKAAEAQSKLKLLEKLKAEQVEIPAAASGAGPGDAKKVTLALPKAPPCYTDVITLQGVSVGWGSPNTPGATPVLQGVNVQIRKGQRVLVLGPNGAGKSTLLKVVSGRIPAWTGQRQLGEGVKLAVFDQDLAQELPANEVSCAACAETCCCCCCSNCKGVVADDVSEFLPEATVGGLAECCRCTRMWGEGPSALQG
jgi:ATPase subunit of ABC transporter with duplicated ATPase domains